jgi:2-polyprenyl-3-methyl-5-hydroxy-6-metoxy-1,4-benzoquinol methylase
MLEIDKEIFNYFSKYLSQNKTFILNDDNITNDNYNFIINNNNNNDFLMKYKNNQILNGFTYDNQNIHKLNNIYISGTDVDRSKKFNSLKILAIIHTYNVEDIISYVIDHLLHNGIHIHIIDNWSEDNTLEIIKKKSINGNLTYEVFPEINYNKYEWEKQLKKTIDICNNSEYDWCIHYDADELIYSPFPELTLAEAISFIDSLGYNCISKNILDFRFLNEQNNNNNTPNDLNYFEYGKRQGHEPNNQIKIFKNLSKNISLYESGGHSINFSDCNKIMYPILFMTKHYQYRNSKQMEKKINDIQNRAKDEIANKGWHTHNLLYKNLIDGFEKDKLILFDGETIKKNFAEIYFRICVNNIIKLSYGIHENYFININPMHHIDIEFEDEFQKEVYLFADKFMVKNNLNSVIDVGCGSGFKLINILGKYDTIGIETEPCLTFLKEKYTDKKWLQSGKSEISFINYEIKSDLVICSDVIEHILNPDELILFLKNLKSKYYILSTPCRKVLVEDYGRIDNGPPNNNCHIREWTMTELVKYLSLNFNILESHYCLLQKNCQFHLMILK